MQRASFKDLTIGDSCIDFGEFMKHTFPMCRVTSPMSGMTEESNRKMYNDIVTEIILNRMRKIAQEIR